MNVAEIHGGPTAPSGRPRRHPFLGGLLVKDRLINEAQLERVLALQEQTEPRPLLGQLLLDQKLLTPHELNIVLAKYRREHLLGDILVETNLVTSAQLDTALVSQRRTGAPLGESLIELGYITERQLKQALSLQLRIAFVDLDRRSIDPGLAGLISERYARRHRVIPIAKTDDRVIVAMEDPTDSDVLTELRACTGLPVESVATTSDVMARALGRLYGQPRDAGAREVGGSAPVGTEPVPQQAPAARPLHEGPASSGREDLQSPLDPLQERAGGWQRRMAAVETLLHEREERRGEVGRLLAELRESHAALTRARRELEAKASAVARLEQMHDALLRRNQALERALAQLEERQAALMRDRELMLERVESALRRLRS
jgi:type II secretion system (T2SS) protein E